MLLFVDITDVPKTLVGDRHNLFWGIRGFRLDRIRQKLHSPTLPLISESFVERPTGEERWGRHVAGTHSVEPVIPWELQSIFTVSCVLFAESSKYSTLKALAHYQHLRFRLARTVKVNPVLMTVSSRIFPMYSVLHLFERHGFALAIRNGFKVLP